MCHFITALLPASADADAVGDVFRAQGRAFVAYVNPTLVPQLAAGERTFLTTSGQCDCGTPLGRNAKNDEFALRDARADAAETARLRRKGWSDARIARALAQREEAQTRARTQTPEQPQTGLSEWIALIREALGPAHSVGFGLMLHQYRYGLDDEPIALQGRAIVRLDAIEADVLASMREDVVYEFRR